MSGHGTPSAQQRLELTLQQWRHWQCAQALEQAPVLERTLDGGLSNHSFLVVCDQRRFVIRIDGVQPARHGLSRSAEWQILRSARRARLAPEPCYFNPELGALVCAYLPADDEQEIGIGELAALLRRIHALPRRHYRLDLGERISRYEAQLKRAGRLEGDFETPADIAYCLARSIEGAPLALCHNDLIPANLLRSGGAVHALDWEYSAMGNPLFDLAGAALGQGLATGEDEALLGLYLEGIPDSDQRAALQAQRVLCRYMEMLWYALECSADDWQAVGARQWKLLEAELAALR